MSHQLTLTGLAEKALRAGGNRPALVHPSRTLTVDDLARESGRVAAGLHARGVRPGDRVALIMANHWEFAILDLAILRLGAVKVPLNDMLPTADIAYMLDHSEAAVAAIGPSMAQQATEAIEKTSSRPLVVSVGQADTRRLSEMTDVVAFTDLTGDEDVLSAVHIGPEDPAALFYTGGTTGRPKGVLHTQRSLAANQLAQMLESEIRDVDQLLLTTPLPHAAGLFLQAALLRGATAHVLPSFDAVEVLRYMRDHDVTWTFLVPTMIYRLLDAARETEIELPALQTIVYGAAPIAPSRLREGLERWGSVFVQLYAQTECPNWGTRLAKGDHRLDERGTDLLASCGRASLMADVCILDDDGDPVPAGEIGEVCLSAPYVLDRYWKDPDATAAKFVGRWIRTGDIGVLDEHGYLYLKDRRNDMIISGGMNVYTSDVERAISQHDAVRQVAVVGIPDEDWGEAVHAVVVADGQLDAPAIVEHCRIRLARYAVPKSVAFVDELPVTAYGKVDKKRVREVHWAGRDRQIH